MKKLLKLALSLIICQAAGFIGSLFTVTQIGGWYAGLNKPSFTPPGYVIGAIWTAIYFLMGISLFLVWEKNFDVAIRNENIRKSWNRFSDRLLWGDWRRINVIGVFTAQLLLNILWSYVFFGRHAPGAAFFELLGLWVAIVYTIVNFSRVSKAAAWFLAPYLLWVTFAGYLNFSVWMTN